MSADKPARPRWRAWAGNIVFVALLVGVFFGVRFHQQRTLIEGPAPVLRAMTLDGAPFDLAGLRGQPVLVYFWATWCPVCRLEQGSIESLARDHRVISVAMQSGSPSEVQQYLHEQGLQVAVINDPDGTLAARWGVRATPTLFVVDGAGTIRFREVGYTSEPGLRLRLWWTGRPAR